MNCERQFRCHSFVSLWALLLGFHTVNGEYALGQANVSFTGQRIFVVGYTPVIGPNGGVGGIDINTDGVVRLSDLDDRVDQVRREALRARDERTQRSNAMRKVSLTRLEKAIETLLQQAENGETAKLPSDMLFLAGLTRVEYLFIYPEQREVVIAGPAEGWTFHAGEVVGAESRKPTMRLDDLLEACQAQQAAVVGNGIRCSIDPVVENMARVQKSLSRSSRVSDRLLKQVESLLGDQRVTVEGVRSESHFARVLVASDYRMKRLAMGLEPLEFSPKTDPWVMRV